ncbi:MAG: mevalonate kinase [Vicingaceae bacterium]
MKLKDPLFYAKILLFGEYSIIEDSMGLSIPYNFYQGQLKKLTLDSDVKEQSNRDLEAFRKHLSLKQKSGELLCMLDLDSFEQDIQQGLIFDSNIPQGFGVGSSGALVAAVYNKYGKGKISSGANLRKGEISKLKLVFSQLESYFHGKSSGIDPLICYLNIPLLIKSKTDIGTVGLPEGLVGDGAIFLIDSGSPGETEPLVNLFMEKLKQDGFRKLVKEEFVSYNDACIQSFLQSDFKGLFRNLKNLSQFLFENFTPMIPSVFHKLWKQGLETNAYYLKLCGSGGGGFILGFTQDLNRAQKVLKGYQLEVIHRF